MIDGAMMRSLLSVRGGKGRIGSG